jgi:hypothetical protein
MYAYATPSTSTVVYSKYGWFHGKDAQGGMWYYFYLCTINRIVDVINICILQYSIQCDFTFHTSALTQQQDTLRVPLLGIKAEQYWLLLPLALLPLIISDRGLGGGAVDEYLTRGKVNAKQVTAISDETTTSSGRYWKDRPKQQSSGLAT